MKIISWRTKNYGFSIHTSYSDCTVEGAKKAIAEILAVGHKRHGVSVDSSPSSVIISPLDGDDYYAKDYEYESDLWGWMVKLLSTGRMVSIDIFFHRKDSTETRLCLSASDFNIHEGK